MQPKKKQPTKPVTVAQPSPAIPPKKKPGQPTKLTPPLAVKIFMLASRGLTDKEIADVLSVPPHFSFTERTINNWKQSPEFFQSLKEAKAEIDDVVEASLLKRATGYNIAEEKLFVINDKITSKVVLKHIPSDTTATLAWLNNRRPDQWRQKIPELSNIADSIGSVLQELRKYGEKKVRSAGIKKGSKG